MLTNQIERYAGNTHTIKLASDNFELINQVKVIQAYDKRWTKQSLKPHMDIQLQIDVILAPILDNVQLDHVKGHQGTKFKKILQWIEKLNVLADKLPKQM